MADGNLHPPVSAAAFAHYCEGRRLHLAGDLHGGLRELQAALKLAGEHPQILDALAYLAADGGDLASAERLLRLAQQIGPSIKRSVQLAISLYNQKRYADAAPLFEAALPNLQFSPDIVDACATCLDRAGNPVRALALYEEVLHRAPTPASAMRVIAALDRQGEHERMATLLRSLLVRWPGHADLAAAAAINALGCGDFALGWKHMRKRVGGECDPRLASLPVWDGVPFAGTLVLTLEPHLGETIMMSSLLVRLAEAGQPVLAELDARLLPLFRRSWPTMSFVARDGVSLQRQLSSGGRCQRATALDILERLGDAVSPPAAGWLCADPLLVQRKVDEYRARWPGKRLVGISWRSLRTQDDGQEKKSIPLSEFPCTLALAGVQFIDLQYGDGCSNFDGLSGTALPLPWRDPEVDAMHDIEALAAQICALDEVVLVSNTTAHLAGALGARTTVLLPKRFPVLWHWGFSGDVTPWYRSVHLLRNPEDSGWAALDHRLATQLGSS